MKNGSSKNRLTARKARLHLPNKTGRADHGYCRVCQSDACLKMPHAKYHGTTTWVKTVVSDSLHVSKRINYKPCCMIRQNDMFRNIWTDSP